MTNKEYIKLVLNLRAYKKGSAGEQLQRELGKLLNSNNPSYLVENGRTAEYLFLKSLNLPEGSEIIVQGFTCNAVINPILWLGLKPVYVDIDPKTLNLNINDLESKISKNTKVIIVQHTFGNPVDVNRIKEIASDKILILEDCAHALGVSYKNRKLGTFGDAAIFSFGIEKVLSSRVGGLLLVNNLKLQANIENLYKIWSIVSIEDTFLWLMNPVIWRVLRKFGGLKLAEVLSKLNLLNMGFYKSELVGQMPDKYPRRLSNALAQAVNLSFLELEEIIKNRKNISKIYTDQLEDIKKLLIPKTEKVSSNVRFPVILKSERAKNKVIQKLEGAGYSVGTWYNPVIYPNSTNLRAMLYNEGDCPIAEDVSKRIINLPTGKNVSVVDAKKITEIVINNA